MIWRTGTYLPGRNSGRKIRAMLRQLILVLAIIVLLVVNWLTFHDIFEPHTARDYLMAVGSLLVVASFGLDLLRGKGRMSRTPFS
jgi:di/tricarboxylate transporter